MNVGIIFETSLHCLTNSKDISIFLIIIIYDKSCLFFRCYDKVFHVCACLDLGIFVNGRFHTNRRMLEKLLVPIEISIETHEYCYNILVHIKIL